MHVFFAQTETKNGTALLQCKVIAHSKSVIIKSRVMRRITVSSLTLYFTDCMVVSRSRENPLRVMHRNFNAF